MAGAAIVLAPVASAAATPPFSTSRRFMNDPLGNYRFYFNFYNGRGMLGMPRLYNAAILGLLLPHFKF
jgi:hypothetical protein